MHSPYTAYMPNQPYNATHIAGDTYVVPGLTNAGFLEGLVIDTCEDEAPFANTPVDTLVITHGHADHFSIGSFLRNAGATVYAARDDASMVENPDINIRGMFSWAKPTDTLTTKLFRGEGCAVDGYLEHWSDDRAQTIALPGHTLGHYGFLTADAVLFSGDSLYLKDLWVQHPLPYAIDPGMVVSSLERLREVPCEWIVPAHGRPIRREEADEHIDHHIAQVHEVEALLVERLKVPHSTEDAIALVSRERGLNLNPAAYWLAVTNVKGYLGELLNRGEIDFYVDEYAGMWKTHE
ncbi:MAG TPA: MBL fold metallo-hydrolase [Coriobacteriia bacterium]|nr:MBL fold metallo-hydrolase [Coriobacteriia bacterium]